jgi:hypothetical protein
LAAKARNVHVNLLQLGTEVFDRKLVERHNRLMALSRQLDEAHIESRGSPCVMPQQRHLATVQWLRLGRPEGWIAR